MFKYMRVEHRRQGEIMIPLDEISLDGIALYEKLLTGAPVDMESLTNERIASASDPGTEEGRERLLNKIVEDVGQNVVELLNCLTSFGEFSAESAFQLVKATTRPTCQRCEMDLDENGFGRNAT